MKKRSTGLKLNEYVTLKPLLALFCNYLVYKESKASNGRLEFLG